MFVTTISTSDRVALRVKRRGLWQARTWRQLTDEAHLPPALADRLIEAATARVAAAGLTAADQAFVVDPAAWRTDLELIAEWRVAGFTLNVPEDASTAAHDLRELRPTDLVASAERWAALHRDTVARLPPPGTWRRRVVDAGLAAPGRLGRVTVRAPLRRALGLGRVRAAVARGDGLAPEVAAFFDRVGVPVGGRA